MNKTVFLATILISQFIFAKEGLFAPHEINSLPKNRNLIAAVIKARPVFKFDIRVFQTQVEKANYKKQKGVNLKKFLKDKGSIWPVIVTRKEIDQFCGEINTYLKPGFYELCQAYQQNCNKLPCHTESAFMKDSATGFFISKDGHFLTNYHVARECIERLKRENGSRKVELCPDLEIEIPEWPNKDNSPIYKKYKGNVYLLRNLSKENWKPVGNDFALLKVNYKPKSFLKLSKKQVTKGTEVWALGFPAKSKRDVKALKKIGYKDADNTLRVSYGVITNISSESSFNSDLDALHGNSGSPVVTKDGNVVGILRNITPDADKTRPTEFSGESIAARITKAIELLNLSNLK